MQDNYPHTWAKRQFKDEINLFINLASPIKTSIGFYTYVLINYE
jgi:hypothetical protein